MSIEKEIPCKLFDIRQWIPDFSIDKEKRAALCFRESLIICSKNECLKDAKPVGGYCILVEPIGLRGHEFLIHVQSSMSVDGHFGGSKVISSSTDRFHCLEEKRTEFVYEDELHEKVIYIGMEDDYYHVKLTKTCPDDKTSETKELSFCDNGRLVSEGVNILLMRYLAIINFEDILTFQSITIDGDIIECHYICTPVERMELDDHLMDIYTIERKMHKQDGTINTVRSYLTPQGRIIRHNWLDVPYLLKINPLTDPQILLRTINVELPLKDRWQEDIEMFSKYLDMKSSKVAEQAEYLTDNPTIKEMIADYVQSLLVVKPRNVIDFTIQHFKAFAREPKTWETSKSETDYDEDLKSQLSGKESNVLCDICGFYIDSSFMKNISSSSSINENVDKKNSEEFSTSTSFEGSHDTITELPKSVSSTSESSKSSGLKRTCDQCQTIVKVCEQTGSYSRCPGCLKVFQVCTKCSVIDQILKKMYE